jgi:antitoxin CptB
MSDDIEVRRKQALFRAQRRGLRELDLFFSAFAENHLPHLDRAQLERFEALLAVPDWQIYGWIMGKEDVPKRFDNDMFALLADYRANLRQ